MKISIGQFKNKKNLLKALAPFYVSQWAKEMIDSEDFTLAQKPQELEVEIKRVSDFGFTEWVTFEDFMVKAKEQGYDILPAEAALALRIAYQEQPLDEWVSVLHTTISASGCRRVLTVGHDRGGGRCVRGSSLDSGYGLDADDLVALRAASPSPSVTQPSSDPLSLELPPILVINGVTYKRE